MIRVFSCRYLRISCSENDHPLFRRYYARSNRERGVKLLRCFPHCCPEHVQRCYCGTSIHVLVTFESVVPAARQSNLVVCARFEPSRVVPLWPNLVNLSNCEERDDKSQRKLQPGEVVSLPESLLLAEKCMIKETVWIRADREGEMKQKYEGAVLFVLNNHRFPKWLYSYNSSITRRQREMTHHLVVYVFQFTGNKSKPNEIDATVLARHESPGFSLVSYRRSGSTCRDAGCDLPALDVTIRNEFAAVRNDSSAAFSSPSEINVDGRPEFKPSNEKKMNVNRTDTRREQPYLSRSYQRLKHDEEQHKKVQPKAIGCSASSVFEKSQDNKSWQQDIQARNCRFQEKCQHLLILWSFLQFFSLGDLKFSIESIGESVFSYWARAADILRTPSPNSSQELKTVVASFLRELCENAYTQHGISSTTPLTTESSIFQVTALLFWCTLFSQSVQRLVHSACSFNIAETTKATELQIRFVQLVSDLYDVMGGVLQEVSAKTTKLARLQQYSSLPVLVDDVLSLVYGRPRFRQLRSRILALLLEQQTSLSEALHGVFQVFTALVRERLIVSATRYRTFTQFQHSDTRHNLQKLWNQRWLLEPRSVNIVDVSQRGYSYDLHLVDIVQLLSEFGCVDVTLKDDLMLLRSAVTILDDAVIAPMTLIFDGKFRLFRVLPSGMSSMIPTAGRWSIGDYTATFSSEASSLEANFFSFSAQEKTRAFAHRSVDFRNMEMHSADVIQLRRVCSSIRLERKLNGVNPTNLFAVLHGVVYSSVYSSSSQQSDMLKLSERTVLERAAVWKHAKWEPLWEMQAEYIPLNCNER